MKENKILFKNMQFPFNIIADVCTALLWRIIRSSRIRFDSNIFNEKCIHTFEGVYLIKQNANVMQVNVSIGF